MVTAEALKDLAQAYCEEVKIKIINSVPKAIVLKFVQEMQVSDSPKQSPLFCPPIL